MKVIVLMLPSSYHLFAERLFPVGFSCAFSPLIYGSSVLSQAKRDERDVSSFKYDSLQRFQKMCSNKVTVPLWGVGCGHLVYKNVLQFCMFSLEWHLHSRAEQNTEEVGCVRQTSDFTREGTKSFLSCILINSSGQQVTEIIVTQRVQLSVEGFLIETEERPWWWKPAGINQSRGEVRAFLGCRYIRGWVQTPAGVSGGHPFVNQLHFDAFVPSGTSFPSYLFKTVFLVLKLQCVVQKTRFSKWLMNHVELLAVGSN